MAGVQTLRAVRSPEATDEPLFKRRGNGREYSVPLPSEGLPRPRRRPKTRPPSTSRAQGTRCSQKGPTLPPRGSRGSTSGNRSPRPCPATPVPVVHIGPVLPLLIQRGSPWPHLAMSTLAVRPPRRKSNGHRGEG